MKTLAQQQYRAELVRRLRTVRRDTRPLWGRMSAHQMICHLSDAYRIAAGEKPVSSVNGLLQRTLVKWIALYLPVRWPTGLATPREVDQLLAGTKPVEFDSDVAALETLLDRIATRRDDGNWPEHPIFGRMSHRSWLRWGYLHMDHHLRQFGA